MRFERAYAPVMDRARTRVGRCPAAFPPALPVVLLAALSPCSCSPDSQAHERPNIVLVVMDTTAARHLSLYGHQRLTTPRLERIGAQGAVFQNAFSTSTWTLPSHASMFTGLPPSSHGATTDNLVLDPSITTLATILSDVGYRTLGFSNNSWVGPSSGLHRGFDRFVNLIQREDKPDYIVHAVRRTADGYKDSRRQVPKENNVHDAGAMATNLRIRQALTNSADEMRSADDGRPLFLFVNYMEPHHPYEPPPEVARQFLPADATLEEALAVPCDPAASDVGKLSLNERQFALLAGLYDAEIHYLDARVGELFDLLGEMGLLKNTLFIVTSDHGEQVGEHGHLGHEANHSLNLYDDLLRVPLVVHAPFLYAPGTRLAHPVQLQDLFATCVTLAAPELLPRAIPSGARVLPGPGDEPDAARVLVSEYHRPIQTLKNDPSLPPGFDITRVDASVHAIRQGEWKLFRASGGARMLFNMTDDGLENEDLSRSRPEVADRLCEALDRWLAAALQLAPAPRAAGKVELNEDALEDLRALGYVR